MERLMFGDLCSFGDGEFELFTIVVCGVSVLLAGGSYWLQIRRAAEREEAEPTAASAIVMALALIPITWVTTSIVFPDPRDHGLDCGYTPDAIFLPIFATVIVFIAFLCGRVFAAALHRQMFKRK